MPTEKVSSSPLGLPGCRVIREDLGVRATTLARALKVANFAVSSWETGLRNASAANARAVADYLCCKTDDLWAIPSDARRAEIKAAYHQREADRAREEARAAS